MPQRLTFVAASFLSLFLEVLLIRWCGAEIRILAYLRNLTLLGCFLGLGLGYAASHRRKLPLSVSFAATAVLVGLAPTFKGLSSQLNFKDMHSWRDDQSDMFRFFLGLGLLALLYSLLAFAFVPIGQALGEYFDEAPREKRIREYTWNVLASLLGVFAFFELSFYEATPVLWFGVALLAAILAARSWVDKGLVLALGAAILFLLVQQEKTPTLEGDRAALPNTTTEVVETRWSPYQKIQLVREHHEFKRPAQAVGPDVLLWDDFSAYVNGHWYSRVGTTDLEVAAERARYSGSRAPLEFELSRQIPYAVAEKKERVLLLGAGMGRDAATALLESATTIDVVDIEPRFIDWGERLHPAHPYSPEHGDKVHIHVDDARRFLKAAPEASYDLVIFCYLDSHGLTSNFTNTNLDSYVYTKESLAEAKRVLAPGGVLAIGFSANRDFIYTRLEALMEETFKAPPLRVLQDLYLETNGDTARFKERAERVLGANLRPLQGGAAVPPTTDDWPFFYLENASVPIVFRAVLLAILLLSAGGVRIGVGRIGKIDGHFFFLGAAFMLVETWAISRASLVYGATWYVSSAVIASLLLAVLVANTVVEKRGPVRLAPAFCGLLLALLAATLLDPSRLLGLPRSAQLALAAPLYAVPFLFASSIFASSFQRAKDPASALASNLLGSVLGGALECLSFATGLRSLGFVALGLYGLAWLAASRSSSVERATPSQP